MSSATEPKSLEITPHVLLKAYACGIFPMAENRSDPKIHWVEPELRGILPLNSFHIPRSLKKFIKKSSFQIRINTAFDSVVELCSQPAPNREGTWINERIKTLYSQLHEIGHAHSVETWQEGELVGGLYGVSLGQAFFGESMFSRQTNASKVALVHLVERLNERDFCLLDTQFITDHLARFGAIEVTKREYQMLLERALQKRADFA